MTGSRFRQTVMVLFFPSGLERLKIAKIENDSHKERATRCVFVSPSLNFMHAYFGHIKEYTYTVGINLVLGHYRVHAWILLTNHSMIKDKPKNLRTITKKKKKKV